LRAARTRAAISLATERVTAVVSVLVVTLVVGLAVPEVHSSGAVSHPAPTVGNAQSPFLEHQMATKTPVLPAATVPPVAAPTSVTTAAPLAAHEVFGFAPYWSLDHSAGFSVAGLTTLDYFSVGINANGTLDESGAGWNGYESQALSTLITKAHGAGVRVVLTVNDFDQHSLNALTSNPAAATTLAKALIAAVQAKSLDGVNLDLEGAGSADQAGLTRLVTTVSDALHQVDPHWQVTMDTYASSAGDPGGFYDIAALANAVDGFFVMEYSPNVAASAQADSPLNSSLFSDLTTIAQYAAAVPAAKVILGVPLYGEDWPTTDDTLTVTATGPVTTLTDNQIAAAGHPLYWDPITESAWTAYQVGTQWHETFFDNQTSMYQISLLATQYGIGGLGMWALGDTGTDPTMVSALDGTPPSVQYATPPSSSTATTTTTVPVASTPSTDSSGVAGETPGNAATSESGGTSGGSSPSAATTSITGTFYAESGASIEEGTPPPAASPSAPQSVALCLVATPPSSNAGCEAPDPDSVDTTTSTTVTTTSTTVPTGLSPPFPGATAVGVLGELVVTNDATLSCLETDDQLAQFDSSPSEAATPQLVVWQSPDEPQYYYVVATTTPPGTGPADCTNATLAFPVPQPASPTPG
jgi:spore germination protein YaaH